MTQASGGTGGENPAGPRQVTVLGIQWANVLEFIHLFRGFKLASNPAKLLVILAAIVLMYAGGRAFDAVWGPQAGPGEIDTYQRFRAVVFANEQERWQEARRQNLRDLLDSAAPATALSFEDQRYYAERPAAAYRMLRSLYEQRFHTEVAKAVADRREMERQRAANPTGYATLGRAQSVREIESLEKRRAASNLLNQMTLLRAAVGTGVFDAFLTYESRQFGALVDNTLTLVRFAPMRARPGGMADFGVMDDQALSNGLLSPNPDRLWRSDTVLGCLANMTITGPTWLVAGAAPMNWRPKTGGGAGAASTELTWGGWAQMNAYRGAYLASLLVLIVFWLLIGALAGGIVCRLAALEFAGRTDTPLPRVAGFVRQRLRQFIKAPLMPLALLAVLGIALLGLGLVGAIPWLGELLVGAAFPLLLGLGFIMMLLTLGTIGGFNLLYPAIAVEGADSFDAMSRSFAYVYARPWRLVTYTVISLVYGAITFLFVGLVVYLVLALTHVCAGWGTSFFGYNEAWYTGTAKFDALWPMPEMGRMVHPTNWWALSWTEWAGAMMLQFWVFLLLGLTAAYAVSFYFSNHTIIYFLLRRSVDGQALTEVYEPEEEAAEPKPAEPKPAEPGPPAPPAPAP